MLNRSLLPPFAAALIAACALVACTRAPENAPAQSSDAPKNLDEAAERKVHAFRIGEVEALALRDGGFEFPNDNQVLGVGRTPEEVAEVLTAAGLPAERLNLSIQPLLVRSGDRVLLFDTGTGPDMAPSGNGLPEAMAAAGVDPGSVTDVFISHFHGDHLGGLLNGEGAPAFANATIHISTPEWEALRALTAEEAVARAGIQRHTALIAAMEPKVAPFSPGAELIPGLVKAVEIRGHTPGHSGYLITSGEESLLYIGDTMHHYVVSVQKPDWTIQFDGDAPTAEASRAELLAQVAESGQRIYAVHFPFPGIGRVERRGEGFAWAPE